MINLLGEAVLAGVTLRNRIVRSATCESLADPEGLCTPALVEVTRRLAEGKTGLIITGHAYVAAAGKANAGKMGVDREECVGPLRGMVEAAHGGGSKIFIQLAHAGAMAMDPANAAGPSPYAAAQGAAPCREMTRDEIHQLVKDFAAAAGRAKRAGFDGAQLHAAHGYLLSQFLSPFFNKRADEYGGTVENRARFLLEALAAVQAEAGKDFPVMVKLNSDDFTPGGLTQADSLAVCKLLDRSGVTALELSGGTRHSHKGLDPLRAGDLKVEDEGYYRLAAAAVKREVKAPVILVGGIRSFEVAERIVNDGTADFVAFSRPLICEPGLAARWESGDRGRALCVSCDACFAWLQKGKGFKCVQAARLRRKRQT